MGRENIKGQRFLLPRATLARETLPDTLRSLGAEIDVVPAYRTRRPEGGAEELIERLQAGTVDAITFTASSTVQNFMEHIGSEARPLLAKTVIACIGPITAKTAEQQGLKVDVVAGEYTVEGLVTALEDFYQK